MTMNYSNNMGPSYNAEPEGRRYMAYDGEGNEMGRFTLSQAKAKWAVVEIDRESGTLTVDEPRDEE